MSAKQGYSTDKRIYDTQETIAKIPSYRQLEEDHPIRLEVDRLLENFDYTDVDAIMRFGNDATGPLIERIKDRYQNASYKDYVSSRISKIVARKLQNFNFSKIVKHTDLALGQGYRKSERIMAKAKRILFGKSTQEQILHEMPEDLQKMAVDIDAQNVMLDDTIIMASDISEAIAGEYGTYDELKKHLVIQHIALKANERLKEDTDLHDTMDAAMLKHTHIMLSQKDNGTIEKLLSASVLQRIAQKHTAISANQYTYLKDYRENGLGLVQAQLEATNLLLQTGNISIYTQQVQESKILLLEAGAEMSNKVSDITMSNLLTQREERYVAALGKANKGFEDAQTKLAAYGKQLTSGTQSMLLDLYGQNNVQALPQAAKEQDNTAQQDEPELKIIFPAPAKNKL